MMLRIIGVLGVGNPSAAGTQRRQALPAVGQSIKAATSPLASHSGASGNPRYSMPLKAGGNTCMINWLR
jgi:hypothetical protein